MIYRPTIEEIREYKDSSDLSISYLQEVVVKGKPVGSGNNQDIGDLIDLYLTVPDMMNDLVVVFTGKTPTDKVIKMLADCMEYLADKNKLTPTMKAHERDILMQCKIANFDPKKKPETLIKDLLEKAEDWWRFTVESVGKRVVAERERSFASEICNATKKNPVTSQFFPDHVVPNRTFFYQVPIYFQVPTEDFSCVECKALPDLVIVSPVKKTIYLVEIRDVWDTLPDEMLVQMIKYKYVDECSFYREALRSKYQQEIADGYVIDVKILFISRNLNAFSPTFAPITPEMMDFARDGGFVTSREYHFQEEHSLQTVKTIHGWKYFVQAYKNTMKSTSNSFAEAVSSNYLSTAAVQAAYFN